MSNQTTVKNGQSHLPQEDPLQPDEEWVEVAPDGGWGWLVLGGTLLISMLIPGTIKSFGVLFIEFLDVFQATPASASWIPALCYFLYCSLGPLSSWLCVKTSYRTVSIIGGLFAASGMILSYFASSILFLCFSYGFLVGTGAGLSYPPGIFIVTSYFVKLRGLANGLAVSGSAFGSIILPPFLRYLLQNYGYRGATLIMGGVTLNVLVGALLYEPVEKHMKRIRVKKTKPSFTPEEEKLLEDKPVNGFEDLKIKLSDIKVSDVSGDVLKPGEKRIMEVSGKQHQNATLVLKGVQKPLLEVPAAKKSRKISSPARFSTPNDTSPRRKASEWPVGKTSRLAGSASHMTRKLSMGMGSNMSTSSFRYISTAWHGSTLVGLHPDFSSTPNVKEEKASFSLCGLCQSKTETKTDSVDNKASIKSLLKDPLFVILLMANATSAIGYTNFIILIPAYAMEIGFDKDWATYLLSIVAALDLVGRVGGAALSDFLKIDKCIYFFGGLLISGISLAVLPSVSSYPAIAFLCGLFGLASGTYIGITAVIMVDLLGEELLASSYGLSLFVNGVLQLVGPPICGLVYEQLHQYGLIFALLGLSLILGGASWILIPFCTKNRNK